MGPLSLASLIPLQDVSVDLGSLLPILFGSAVLTLVGVMLTTRESRQKRYDERIDKRTNELEAENKDLDTENSRLRIENTRLQTLLWSWGIDPASPARVHDDQGSTP